MEKKNISKFPKGFFQMERPTITASESLKNVKPIEWNEKEKEPKTLKIKPKGKTTL